MSKMLAIRACFPVICLFFLTPLSAAADPVAIIVNKNNPVSEIKLQDLNKMYRGFSTRWKDGQKILPVHRNKGQQIRGEFFRIVLDAQSDKVLPGAKPAVPPATVDIKDDDAVLRFVSVMPNAIAYVYHHKVNDSVRVLKVDDYMPQQSGYPIK